MDIKLIYKFKTEKERCYAVYGLLALSLSALSGAAALVPLTNGFSNIIMWLLIYLSIGISVYLAVCGIKLTHSEGPSLFLHFVDKWHLETPVLLFVLFNMWSYVFYYNSLIVGVLDSFSSYEWGFSFLLLAFNLFLLYIPIMLVSVLLFFIFIRHLTDKRLRSNTWAKQAGPKLAAFIRERKKLYARKYRFQKRQFLQTVTGCITLCLYFLIILFIVPEYSSYVSSAIPGVILIILFPCLFIYGIYLYLSRQKAVGQMGIVLDEIESLEKGCYSSPDPILEKSPYFSEVSRQLTSIQNQLQNSASEQKKSERMKVDLITNVSHDLKTPLTSIISYVDLLQKEENLSDEANDYLKILAKKSEHLKDMVQDLFEISKATSGSIELELEELNMRKLLEQTLGDMEDQIQSSGLTIKKNFCNEEAFFLGDGKRIYRVYQNLIENALKYSLKGTRIYLEIGVSDHKIVTALKNIAAYDMNFTNGEITERFIRGDEARSSEGNGLGLSIAKSFSEMCGGTLEVNIDGDLFKVIVTFPQITTVSTSLSTFQVS